MNFYDAAKIETAKSSFTKEPKKKKKQTTSKSWEPTLDNDHDQILMELKRRIWLSIKDLGGGTEKNSQIPQLSQEVCYTVT